MGSVVAVGPSRYIIHKYAKDSGKLASNSVKV